MQKAGSHDGPIHLMLTDIVMPRMPGNELAERLKPLRPETKVIFLSAHSAESLINGGTLGAGAAYLAKPFTPEALVAAVRERLDAPSAQS